MATYLSDSELAELIKTEAGSKAILDPVTNTESLVSTLFNVGAGGLNTINNLTGNIVDLMVQGSESPVARRVIDAGEEADPFSGMLNIAKAPFGETQSGAIDALFGRGVTKDLFEATKKKQESIKAEQELSKQYAQGGLGQFAGETIAMAPIARFGTMKSTIDAIKSGANSVDIAKSISKDTASNSVTLGASELALAKFYGKSDEEAVGDALVASVIGAGGTPLLGVGALFGKRIARSIEDGEEAMAQSAGGGTPPIVETKSGREFTSEEVKSGQEAVENVEFEVSSPVEKREPLKENQYVPTTNNPMKFEYSYDERGRVYTTETNLLSPQGTAEQKATLSIKDKPEITNVNDEVRRRVDFYNNKESLREAYGQAQARFKKEGKLDSTTKAQLKQKFIKDQYASLIKDKSLSREFRDEARSMLVKLNKKKITREKVPEKVKESAEQRYIKENIIKRPSDDSERITDLEKRFEATIAKAKKESKEGFKKKATNTVQEAVTNVVKKAKLDRPNVIDAVKSIKKKETLAGRKGFVESKITPELRKKYPNETKLIEDYQARVSDLELYRNGRIKPSEFRYREKLRIDEKLKGELSNIDLSKADEIAQDIADKYMAIGIHETKERILKKITPKIEKFEPKDGVKKEKNTTKELEKSKQINTILKNRLKTYQRKYKVFGDKAKVPRKLDGSKALSQSQIDDIKQGILTIDEIANKTSPVSTNSAKAQTIKKAREFASKKVNTTISKNLGIKGRFKLPESIKFKDTVLDASNSVAQITTVLLGSKRLAKLSKLFNSKEDIRDIIAEEMKRLGQPRASKDTVKPLFMTENYGQMRKGLVRNVMKDMKMSKDEAEAFVDAYYKASESVAPEMANLRSAIFKQFQKDGKTEFSWKLPDGFEVKFKLTKTVDNKISIQGSDFNAKIDTGEFDEFARALMPNIIHSVDAYVARRMNANGIPTIHDAYVIKKGDEVRAERIYTEVMQELNDSDLLHDIMTSIGYKGKPLKTGDLDSDMIAKSKDKLSVEHEAGSVEKSELRGFDVSKQSTPEDVMRDYMASGNYRQISTNQLIDSIVNEAGYSNEFTKMAREGDDVFERQVALAMQSPVYNKSLSIKVPDGVNAKVFNRVQEEIFNEARAKLEYNPMLRGVVQGDRKFFDDKGRIVGDKFRDYYQILTEEKRIYRKLLKSKSRRRQKQVSGITPEQIKSWKENKVLNERETLAKSYHDEAVVENISSTGKYKDLFNQQTKPDERLKQFNTLEAIKNIHKSEVQRTVEILYKQLDTIPAEKQQDLMKLIYSDYESIRGMTKKQADEIWNSNKQLRDIADEEIYAMAKGLGKQSEQYGAWLPNAHLVAKRYNLDPSAEPIIDQLVSIRAMRLNNAWDVLDKYHKGGTDSDIEFLLDTMTRKRKVSQDVLFSESPEKYTKGYTSEVYRGNKKINDDNSISYDADDKYEEGVLGYDRENNKVGTLYETEPPKFENSTNGLKDEIAWMKENRLRKNEKGQYRKVPTEDIKRRAGKNYELAEVISDTIRTVEEKVKERSIVNKIIVDDSFGLLFSDKPTKGMVKITEEQGRKLPYELRDKIKYVDKDLMDNLLGRDEVRLYRGNNETLKIADRLMSNLATAFKQNVVLKNPASYVNALLVNQTIGATAGINPKQLYSYQKDAIRDLAEMRKSIDVLTKQKLTGKDLDKALVDKLKNNDLFRMERAGLSTNRVEGVVGDDDLLGSMLEDHVSSPIFKMARLMNLNQKTTAGRATIRMFSNIDTMGRYMVVKGLMKNNPNMSMREAVLEANGLFGNMDKMVPPFVQLLDSYGFIPFVKWYMVTTPSLLKLVKNNPKKALGVAIGVYMLSDLTETNLSTVNPIEAAVDFAEQSLPFGTIERIEKIGLFDTMSNRLRSSVLPKYIDNAIKSPYNLGLQKLRKQRLGEPWYDDSMDYRGFTQQVIEDSL